MKQWLLSGLLFVACAGVHGQEVKPAAPPRVKLTDEQKAEQKAELEKSTEEAWSKLSLDSKAKLIRMQTALGQMPAEQRRAIHQRIDQFLNMSDADREQVKKNAELWRKMTPKERTAIRQKFEAHRKEFEEKWRQEHPDEEPPPFPPRDHRADAPPKKSPNPNPQPNEGEKP